MPDWIIVMRDELTPEIYQAMADLSGKQAILFNEPEDAIAWIDDVEGDASATDLPDIAFMNNFFYDDMRGTAVAQHMRQSLKLKEIVIVLSDTGHYPPDFQQAFMDEADADLYLPMPSPKFTELIALFNRLIEQKKRSQHL